MERERIEDVKEYEMTEEERIEKDLEYNETRQELEDFIQIIHIN